MRVLYILHTTDIHGATISFLTLLKGMVSKGIETVVILPKDNSKFRNKLENLGSKVYVVNSFANTWQNIYGWHAIVKYPYLMTKQYLIRKRQVKEIKKIIKDEHIDLVHTNVGVIYAGHYAAHYMGIPHVWHIREYGDLDFNMHMLPSKKAFRKKLRKDWVITITKDLLRYNNLGNTSKAVAIYNGVRSRNDVCLEYERRKQFLCASRIAENKGHAMVVEEFIRFCKLYPEYKLVILGSGNADFINKLKKKIQDENCEDKVEFIGHVDNVTDFMRVSRALIVASVAEGFGRMTAEAAFAGCPVIGRNTGGTKEILKDTGGLLFDDADGLYNCMKKMADLPDSDYYSMIEKAQIIAKELYSEESYIEKVHTVYKKALCTQRKR